VPEFERGKAMTYSMCRPASRYLDVFISDDEMAMLETIVKYVEKEIFPKRLDLEGGWHRDEKLAEDTLDDLYAKLVALGYQKAGVPTAYGGLGICFSQCKAPRCGRALRGYGKHEKGQGVRRQTDQ
jgi:alkylation response protein AidB-like acyl-CoA dehydrogenase